MSVRRAGRSTPGGTVEGPIEAGLDAIRAQFHVPGAFPDDVLAAADDAARRRPGPRARRSHATGRSCTLDPAGSTDLDQAFAIEPGRRRPRAALRHRRRRLLRRPRRPDRRTRRGARGETIYLPDGGLALYPPALSRGGGQPAARRAAAGGGVHGARRRRRHGARSTASSGPSCAAGPSSPTTPSTRRRSAGRFAELSPAHRAGRGSTRRATGRVPGAGAEPAPTAAGRLRFDARLESEDQNAGMSLATNLAVADALLGGRHRAVPGDGRRARRARCGRLRHTAHGVRPRLAGRHVARPLPALAPTRRPARRRPSCSPCAAPAGRRRYAALQRRA